MLMNLILGWWSFRGVIFTPFILLHNFISLLSGPDPGTLAKLLRRVGINLSDVVVDASGLTAEQRGFVEALLGVLCEAVWADGEVDPREVVAAVEIVHRVLGPAISAEEVTLRIEARYHQKVELHTLSGEQRLLLFRAAAAIVGADGRLTPAEERHLRALAQRLLLHVSVVDELLAQLGFQRRGDRPPPPHPELARAASILGVSLTASPAEAKTAYRRQAMRHHPDRAPSEQAAQAAHSRMAEINWAYRVYLQRGAV